MQVRFRTPAFFLTLKCVLRPFDRKTAGELVAVLTDRRIVTHTRVSLFEYLLFNTLEENTTVLLETTEKSGYTFEGGETVMTMAQELVRRGRVEGRKEVARRMLEKGLSIELIVETTGLTRDVVAALQEKK